MEKEQNVGLSSFENYIDFSGWITSEWLVWTWGHWKSLTRRNQSRVTLNWLFIDWEEDIVPQRLQKSWAIFCPYLYLYNSGICRQSHNSWIILVLNVLIYPPYLLFLTIFRIFLSTHKMWTAAQRSTFVPQLPKANKYLLLYLWILYLWIFFVS